MGCDIHVYFDRWNGEEWELPFPPVLDTDWWWEQLIEEKVENGMAHTVTGKTDDNEAREALEEIFKNMPMEKANKEYLYSTYVYRNWCLPSGDDYWDRIDCRNYDWFAALGGVRDYHDKGGQYGGRGVPSDAHPLIQVEYIRWDADGHSHSWVMVKDILENPNLQIFPQVTWLRKYITDPENTRMIFWFDN